MDIGIGPIAPALAYLKIKAKEMSVEYCNTRDMLGDYFSKPVQGKQFYKFRKEIMNIEDDNIDDTLRPSDYPETKESMS